MCSWGRLGTSLSSHTSPNRKACQQSLASRRPAGYSTPHGHQCRDHNLREAVERASSTSHTSVVSTQPRHSAPPDFALGADF